MALVQGACGEREGAGGRRLGRGAAGGTAPGGAAARPVPDFPVGWERTGKCPCSQRRSPGAGADPSCSAGACPAGRGVGRAKVVGANARIRPPPQPRHHSWMSPSTTRSPLGILSQDVSSRQSVERHFSRRRLVLRPKSDEKSPPAPEQCPGRELGPGGAVDVAQGPSPRCRHGPLDRSSGKRGRCEPQPARRWSGGRPEGLRCVRQD